MKRNRLEHYGCAAGIILVCALFICMGREMMVQDAGMLQLQSWSLANEELRMFQLTERSNSKLEKLSKLSGQKKEKLLAALMLKYHFSPQDTFSEAGLLADMLGYENLENQRFEEIASVYRRLLEAVEYLPTAKMVSSKGEKRSGTEEMEIRIGKTYETVLLARQQENAAFPVVSMMDGEIVNPDFEESVNSKQEKMNSLCIESSDGIRIQYDNLNLLQKEWGEKGQVKAGDVLGFAKKEGLKLQFWLQGRDEKWYPYQGQSSILCGKGTVLQIMDPVGK